MDSTAPCYIASAARWIARADAIVRPATADIGHHLVDLCIGRMPLLLEKGDRGHDLARLAIGALRDLLSNPRTLGALVRFRVLGGYERQVEPRAALLREDVIRDALALEEVFAQAMAEGSTVVVRGRDGFGTRDCSGLRNLIEGLHPRGPIGDRERGIEMPGDRLMRLHGVPLTV